jgi:hypothetical protein
MVTVGLRDEDLGIAEIRGELAAGDTVLLGAALGLSSGTPVKVSAPNDQQRSR